MSEEITIDLLLKSAMCEIEQALKQARNEALEEAAKVCDDLQPNSPSIIKFKEQYIKAIRELKESE